MTSLRKHAAVTLLALAAASAAHAAPTTVFSDSFEDNDVTDWTVSASSNITTPVATIRTDAVQSGTGALWTYFNAPGGGSGAGTVRASHSFFAPVTADYTLTVWARSAPCSGCTMSYDVLVYGSSLARKFFPNSFEQRVFALTNLAAGTHTLTLGMHTTGASSGRFQATFDEVTITTLAPIPEPGIAAMLLAGLVVVAAARRRRALR